MNVVSPVYFSTIVIYLTGLVAVAIYLSRRVKSQEDFAVAGRSLPAFVLFGTLVATWMGTGSLFGHSEKAYQSGIVILLLLIADVVGISVLYTLAGRVRRMQELTIQDLLEKRFNAYSRLFCSIALIIAYVTIVSYQYRAAGTILNLSFPSITPEWGSAIAAIFIIGFTCTAGLLSVAYTDVVQGVTMIVGLAICLPLLIGKAGGVTAVITALPVGHLDLFRDMSLLKLVGLTLPAFLLILGDANMYQRFFAAKSEGNARKGVFFMIFGILFIELCIVGCALIGKVLIPGLENPGRILAALAIDQLPMVLGCIMMAVMTAIVVSTADSYLLAPSTSFVRDIYQRFLRPAANEKEILRVSRLMVVVLGLVAFALSKASGGFLSVALYAYTIYGAAITPSLMAALFWKRATAAGSVASILGATLTCLIWELAGLGPKLGLADMDAVVPAITVSCLLLVFVSLGTAKQEAEKLKPFGLA
ncbi:MAG: sodium:solute symporter family protein [Bdellovibrionales bacterium]|nr:sodium:solute symporter family protein [Bdellovibrionales bacterium]